MTSTDLIPTSLLTRKAVVYVRQCRKELNLEMAAAPPSLGGNLAELEAALIVLQAVVDDLYKIIRESVESRATNAAVASG